MNIDDPRLADYLAGLLDETERAAVEAELELDLALKVEVESLREVQNELERSVASLEEAEAITERLPFPAATPPSRWSSGLRYVAVVTLGFGLGFWARGGPEVVQPEAPPAVAQTETSESFARFASTYHKLGREKPQMSGLGRGLLALARGNNDR